MQNKYKYDKFLENKRDKGTGTLSQPQKIQ
jgi:hypothetical protein